jgi:hypothetical protein
MVLDPALRAARIGAHSLRCVVEKRRRTASRQWVSGPGSTSRPLRAVEPVENEILLDCVPLSE